MAVMMMVREARVEAGSLLPTGQSDTGKFPAAGKHYFTLENITSHWNTGAHVRDIGIQTHVPLHWNVGTHLHLTTLGHTDKTLLFLWAPCISP